MKEAFIFDMDGVLVDSNPTHKIALQQFCKQHGYTLTEQQLREKIYGRTNRDWLLNLFGDLSDETIRHYADEKESLFRALYHDIKPVEGLISFLEKIKTQGIPCCIATSAPRANVDFTLLHTGIGGYFSVILDDSFVSQGKPDPEIYLKSAAALGREPAQCVVIEDSLSGVEAARRAGCKVVGITTTHTAVELAEADLIITNFEGLVPELLLSKLF
ncbi:MAG: HAD family phosphatase [Cyclobacteriaceae bacterium]|jgi:beta-phosphoglucomutase|nr:HAD family phosphatase [Cyclobacteriaceae bacterium]MDH4296716.1 HAD family phosphatase [Cyclobacteriaceae bacterium]MDH5248933.1 HAD family phosphatase [Cyclobacteriaceae bacterium]